MTESENHLNGENDSHCIICDQAGWDANLSTKGFLSIISSSKKRQDGKHEQLLPLISNKQAFVVHEQCRKSYTSSKNIHYFLKKRNYELDTLPPRNLRTLQINFDFKTHCLICAECINFPNVEKNPKRQSIGSVEIVDKLDKCSTLQNTLLELCSKRSDKQALDVKSRIICAGDIRAAEAIYHRQCLQTFLRCKQDCDTNERNLNSTNSEGFSNLCTWLSSQTGSQFTISDLQVKLSSFLPEDVEPYSVKHLKRKLQDHFGNKLSITELGGKKNVFQFRHTASEILHQAFLTDDQEDGDELIAKSRQLGKKLRNLLSDIKFDTEHFPSPDELNINALESQVPEALLVFMKRLLGLSSTSSDRNTLQMISLCHILMNAVAPNPYQSPLLFSTGLFIHQTTRSKLVLNLLSSLGMTMSYDTILDFERSAVTSRNIDDLHPGIGVNEDGTEGFCQWIADNFDYNEDTISGHNSTHVMGIIACQTPASTQKLSVRRQKNYATDILAAGDFSNIQPYRNHHTNAMAKVKFNPVVEVIVPKLKQFLFQDIVWMLSNFRSQITPGWQGFMSDVTHGEYMQSKVLYHPMIPLNPQTNEAVYSTMMFVDKQRQKIGQCCALLTFDQPLYAKAYKIKTENPLDFEHIQLRLGGFHQLMSFLGSGSLHILLFEQPHEDIMDEDGDNREHENDSVGSGSLSDIEQIAKDISRREIQFDDFEETVDNILGKVDKEKSNYMRKSQFLENHLFLSK
ncbi:uncharacterized protein LOC124140320 [Haliotis rufescens]|uniref:uncharacterized protein LOC124140320 n=1 Tax=Haliotis rufescens TaxID=6454 RepID=UPI00201E7A4F|nr:uncharacterized protein LOC124140320 [Haliotis rufescens]